MLPSDRRVEYFMIKRAIILQRSRPRLRLKGGGAQITVQTPSQQRKGTAPVRGGSGRGKAIWVNPRKTQTKKTISNSDVEKHRSVVQKSRFESGPGGYQQDIRAVTVPCNCSGPCSHNTDNSLSRSVYSSAPKCHFKMPL